MILDERIEFADATAVGAPNNSTVNVGDIYDLGAAGGDIGVGTGDYEVVIQVTTPITSGGSATVSFLLVSDAGTTIAVDGNQSVHHETAVIAVASLVAGYELRFRLPRANVAYERYLGIQCRENAGQALTAGKINAFLTPVSPAHTAYPDAVN